MGPYSEMEKYEKSPNGKEVMNESIENRNAGYISIGKEVFSFINKSSWKAIFKVFVVVMLTIIGYFCVRILYTVTDDENIAKVIANRIEQQNNESEETNLNLRDAVVTPRIQRELEKLCYTINADRAFIFELHNGKKNPSGLPFRFADMSYEESNEERNVERVAMQFQNIPLTLYRYPHYLAENKYIYGDLEAISQIDNGFAGHIDDVGGKYLGMIYMTNKGLPLGFLCVSFHEEPKVSEGEIRSKLEQYAKIIAPLLDMSTQIKDK